MDLPIELSPHALTFVQIQTHHVSRSGDPPSESGVTQKVMGEGFGITSDPVPTQKGEFLTPPSECFFSVLLTLPTIQTLSEDCLHIIVCLNSEF